VLAAAAAQHGVLTHAQLVALGVLPDAIVHRVARGKLHRLYRGVYAVGRPQLNRHGEQKAALLACSPGSTLSHSAGLEYWRAGPRAPQLEITICPPRRVRHPRLRIHRSRTLVDMAPRWHHGELDDTIERMSQMNLRSPEQLLNQLNSRPTIPGSAMVHKALTHWILSLTDTQLEQRFLPIAKRAGLPQPLRQQRVNGHRVDFYFPDLGLVVEADSLRYHRTAARQTADARRDQAHLAAGQTPVRFSHAQITYEADHVERTLRQIASRRAAST
jgi:very-short-patch-repair endonuclease